MFVFVILCENVAKRTLKDRHVWRCKMFSERDLDTVLYGYIRPPCDSTGIVLTGHALSGLRLEQLSYGQ